MNQDTLPNLPPLCRDAEKKRSLAPQYAPIRLKFGITQSELPYFLRGNKALIEHLERVRIERNKILVNLEKKALAETEAVRNTLNAALSPSAVDGRHEQLETVLSMDFTLASQLDSDVTEEKLERAKVLLAKLELIVQTAQADFARNAV